MASTSSRIESTGRIVTAVAILAILWICVRPAPGEVSPVLRLCLMCGYEATPNLLLNILLYAPLGFGLLLSTGSVVRATVIGVLLSAAIESAQLFIPGRYSGIGDVVANGVGTAVGGLIATRCRELLFPGRRLATALAISAGVLGAFLLWLPGELVRPVVPLDPLYSGWTPELRSMDRYGGRVVAAKVGDEPLEPGRLDRTAQVRASLLEGSPLMVRFTVGSTPSRLAPLLHLSTWDRTEVLLIGVEGTDVLFRPRLRAREFALAAPDFRARGLLGSAAPGDTITLDIRAHEGGGFRISTANGSDRIAWSAAGGWAFLKFPPGLGPPGLRALDALWLLLLLLPGAYWAPTGRSLVASAGLPLGILVAGSRWTLLGPVSMFHMVFAVSAVLLGRMLRLALGRRNAASSPPRPEVHGAQSP